MRRRLSLLSMRHARRSLSFRRAQLLQQAAQERNRCIGCLHLASDPLQDSDRRQDGIDFRVLVAREYPEQGARGRFQCLDLGLSMMNRGFLGVQDLDLQLSDLLKACKAGCNVLGFGHFGEFSRSICRAGNARFKFRRYSHHGKHPASENSPRQAFGLSAFPAVLVDEDCPSVREAIPGGAVIRRADEVGAG
jgi:hypothetical protein